jgi:2,4-dienoyl-CoA reductase-like NADH-dependent reductase (Old Yellow Enzyme family)
MDSVKFAKPMRLRGLEIPNRVWMSPMCQYSELKKRRQQDRVRRLEICHYQSPSALSLIVDVRR